MSTNIYVIFITGKKLTIHRGLTACSADRLTSMRTNNIDVTNRVKRLCWILIFANISEICLIKRKIENGLMQEFRDYLRSPCGI